MKKLKSGIIYELHKISTCVAGNVPEVFVIKLFIAIAHRLIRSACD